MEYLVCWWMGTLVGVIGVTFVIWDRIRWYRAQIDDLETDLETLVEDAAYAVQAFLLAAESCMDPHLVDTFEDIADIADDIEEIRTKREL